MGLRRRFEAARSKALIFPFLRVSAAGFLRVARRNRSPGRSHQAEVPRYASQRPAERTRGTCAMPILLSCTGKRRHFCRGAFGAKKRTMHIRTLRKRQPSLEIKASHGSTHLFKLSRETFLSPLAPSGAVAADKIIARCGLHNSASLRRRLRMHPIPVYHLEMLDIYLEVPIS